VRQLAEYYGKSPDLISEPELRTCLSVIYGCGLRLQEGIGLQVRDVDSQRMCLHIRHSKGRARTAQQRVQPTPPLRHFGPEKVLVIQPVLPRKWVVLRWRG
jgi:site-specific recombinase XerD